MFLPNPIAHAQRKIAICAKYGIVGLAPLNEDVDSPAGAASIIVWRVFSIKTSR